MVSLARVAVLFVCVAAAGCGSGSETAGRRTYDFTITYWPEGRGSESRTATLTCPAGGTHPDPEDACEALAGHLNALRPVPNNMPCTEIYGGRQVATISGTVEAEGPVHARFSRANGCEIARWDALAPVLELAN